MKNNRRFGRSLGVELCRKPDFEEDILHDISAERLRQAELALTFRFQLLILVCFTEQDIIKTPLRCRQYARNAHFTTHRYIRQTYRTTGGIPSSPGFPRACVGCMPIGAQRLPIYKRMGK